MQAGAGTAGQGGGQAVILLPPGRVAAARTRAMPARPSALARAGWFVWLPVWLSFGIGMWFALRFQPGPVHYATAGAAGLAGLALWGVAPRWGGRIGWGLVDGMRLGGLALVVAALGFGLSGLRAAQVDAPVLGWRYYGPVEGRVIEVDRSARDRIRITLDQVSLGKISAPRTPERVRLSLSGKEGTQAVPTPGARVRTLGHVSPPPGPAAPGAFDYRRQAWFERLGAIGYTRNPIEVLTPAPEGGAMWLPRLRRALSAGMQAAIPGQEGAVAAALMTGDRSAISEATNALMRDSNLYHIVSISGLHMSMLAGFLYAGLRAALAGMAAWSGRGLVVPVHKIAALVALAGAAFYMALADGGVATERAFVMVAVMLGAIIVDRRAISLRTVSLAALILLVLSPEALTQAGFQMSFAATVALILNAGPWARWSPRLPALLRPPALLLISSLVAGLATTPLAALHFGRMSDYGLLANLLAVPVMGAVVMPAGVIAALLAPLGLAQPALWVMGLGTGWMLDVARYVAGISGSVTMVPAPPGIVLPLLGLGGALLALGGTALPGRAVRAAGGAALAAALGVWALAERPMLLIAPEAEAVGLMTDAGRALSKPKGGAFITANWLTDDGDPATAEEAAARPSPDAPAWTGPAAARRAVLPDGRQLVHLTGKGAPAAVAEACTDGAVVVVAAYLPPEERGGGGGCLLIDKASLARSGALAMAPDGALTSVRALTGTRPWSPAPRARRPRPAPPPDTAPTPADAGTGDAM